MVFIDEKRIRDAYLEEINELLEFLNTQLLELEENPENNNIINEIFRLTHSIKSESALVGFENIASIAHKMEDIFEKIRKGEMKVEKTIMDPLFKSYDKIYHMVRKVQSDGVDTGIDISNELSKLKEVISEGKTESLRAKAEKIRKSNDKKTADNKRDESETDAVNFKEKKLSFLDVEFTEFEEGQIEDGLEKGEKLYKVIYKLIPECDMRYPRAYLVYNNFSNIGTVVKTIPDVLFEGEDEKFKSVDLYLLTNQGLDEIKKCTDVDQVDTVEIYNVEPEILKKAGMSLSDINIVDIGAASEDEMAEAERIEKEWNEKLKQDIKDKSKSIDKDAAAFNILKNDNIEVDNIDSAKKEKDLDDTQKAIVKETLDRAIKRQTIRVDTDRLDILMNLVGELIINHSRFLQLRNTLNEKSSIQDVQTELEDASNEFERILDQMQSSMMLVRMVPIGTIFSRFPRMIRDLANTLSKNVNFEISGESTEIDKSIIELIAEPLTHILRNAIDHGIEFPDERYKKGKPREGKIILQAYQKGSHIYIVVEDDGKGLNVNSIKEEGVKRKLVSQQQASVMSDNEAYNLIFEPGFSTKDEISDVSGRGVGMDVVRNQIEKLRGHIEISSKINKGTTFRIVLPLTLTIIEAMLVNIGENIFAIPVNEIDETLIIDKADIRDFDDYKVYDLRNETVAILQLSELVGFESDNQSEEVFVVIVNYERRKIGLIVDELLGHQDIVIKALDDSLKHLEGIAGATVLGDGRIALILEINSLVRERKKEINKLAESLGSFKDQDGGFDTFYDKLNKEKSDNKVLNNLNPEK